MCQSVPFTCQYHKKIYFICVTRLWKACGFSTICPFFAFLRLFMDSNILCCNMIVLSYWKCIKKYEHFPFLLEHLSVSNRFGTENAIWKRINFERKPQTNGCVKSVCIRSYSGLHLPRFGMKTEGYEVSLRIQSECGKIRTRTIPNTDTFHAMDSDPFWKKLLQGCGSDFQTPIKERNSQWR